MTGCGPTPRGYIVPDSGGYVLKMIPGCDSVFSQVIVSYLSDANGQSYGPDDLKTVWCATFADGAGVPEVRLFSSPANADSQLFVTDVDLTREVLVWWNEADTVGGAVSGVLADIKPGNVLWYGGFEDAQEFARKAPGRPFGC